MIRRVLTALLSAGVFFACAASSEKGSEAPSEDELVGGGITAQATDPCVATLVFLQKDAYKSTGRSSELWPPHTTTVLEVSCQTARGEQHIAPFKENYGTKPGTKDAKGNDILKRNEMDPEIVTARASWGEMRKLVTSYEACGCDEKGFLGLDTIDVEGKGILEKLAPLLSCPDSVDALLLALKEKRFDDAKVMAARCRIKDDVSPEQVARTAAEVQADVKKTLAEHHVCNNNALLQADLFARFRDHKNATACDPHDRELCYGPKLFFNPAKEVR